MITKVKFVHVVRTIDPKTRIHYLDAVDEDGVHWSAEMSPKIEKWLVYTKLWTKDPQHPLNYTTT
jgi:hypothetical protein